MEPTVLQQVAVLRKMPLDALRLRWRALFGTEPPGYKREHLIRRLAYRIQELAYGGLSDAAKEQLTQIADAAGDQVTRKKRRKAKSTQPLPGTRLVREWRGVRHEVIALVGGYEYQGKPYRSLSAVAKAITGAHWSGPQFFGLRTAKKAEAKS